APSTMTARHRTARAQRRIWITDGEDGMAALHAHVPAALIHGMFDRLSQMAHALRTENLRAQRDAAREGREFITDDRTVDEIRADLLVDLVLTGAPAGHDTEDGLLGEIDARIEVTVPVTTLMDVGGGADDAPGDGPVPGSEGRDGSTTGRAPAAELDGVVPIDAATARILAGAASGWDRVLTHPIDGRVLAVDRYRPSRRLRRHLRARDQRCRFPGCGVTARKCDLDHNHAASSGGETCESNLASFCRRHHVLKHHSPWHVAQGPGGVLEWTSPTGRTYIDAPPVPNTVTFTSSDGVRAPF
ncbi:HNH endonuclease signature motif containing protein, partial [Microbacterium hydrocarbonoxydans]